MRVPCSRVHPGDAVGPRRDPDDVVDEMVHAVGACPLLEQLGEQPGVHVVAVEHGPRVVLGVAEELRRAVRAREVPRAEPAVLVEGHVVVRTGARGAGRHPPVEERAREHHLTERVPVVARRPAAVADAELDRTTDGVQELVLVQAHAQQEAVEGIERGLADADRRHVARLHQRDVELGPRAAGPTRPSTPTTRLRRSGPSAPAASAWDPPGCYSAISWMRAARSALWLAS